MKNKFIKTILGLLLIVSVINLTSCKIEDDEDTDCYLKLNFDNELVFDGKTPHGTSSTTYNYFWIKQNKAIITSDYFGKWMFEIDFREDLIVEAGKTYQNEDLFLQPKRQIIPNRKSFWDNSICIKKLFNMD